MKLTAILLLAAALQVSAKGFGQAITLHLKNASLEKTIIEIERQSGFSFVYGKEQLAQAKAIDLIVNNEKLEKVLELVFKDQPLSFTISGKYIALKQKAPLLTPVILSEGEGPLTIDIKGRVTNENGDPVRATVTVKGTTKATSTNDNGEFVLIGIDENATLVVTGVSIETLEVGVKGQSSSDIKVKSKVIALNEVVINKGYYSTTQKLNTGSVYKVKGEEIASQPINDPIKALQGIVPGLYITQNSGLAGSSLASVQLRGRNTISGTGNNNKPLIVVDGVPYPSVTSLNTVSGVFGGNVSTSLFNAFNTDDIESIEVLKDADATALYGTRGANGIILITTKKAKSGKTLFNVNVSYGQSSITREYDLMNTQQYLQMRRKAFSTDGVIPTAANAYDLLVWDTTAYTNWAKVLSGETATIINIRGSIEGGNGTTQYRLSGNFMRQTTVIPGNFYNNVAGMHLTVNSKSNNQRFNLQIQADYTFDKLVLPIRDPYFRKTIAPNAPAIYDAVGNYNWANNTWTNPIAALEAKSDEQNNSIRLSLIPSYQINKYLTVKATVGYNDIKSRQYNLTPLLSLNPATATASNRSAIYGDVNARNWIFEPQMSYALTIRKSKIDILAGGTLQDNKTFGYRISASGFTSDALLRNLAGATTKNIDITSEALYRIGKFFGRASYNFDERYLLNLTASREGSSRFGPANQFGTFYSAGAAYIFTNEHLFKNKFSFLSFGKLRLTYGTSGNDNVGDYSYLNTYLSGSQTYQGLSSLNPTQLYNPYLQWEKVKKLDIGLDLNLFNDRISLTFDYYRNRCDNQLVGYVLPTTTGFATINSNFPAVVQNTGCEISINTTNLIRRDFRWESSINLAVPRNKLIAFPGIENSSYRTLHALGEQLSMRYGLTFTGLDQTSGIYTFKDVNNDGMISNPSDWSLTKGQSINYFGGLGNKFTLGRISANFFLQFVSKTAPNFYSQLSVPGNIVNLPKSLVDQSWNKPGSSGPYQGFSQDFNSATTTAFLNYTNSSAVITDASFIRLRNVSVSYSFKPSKVFPRLRVYFEGQNLFLLTKYDGADPELTSISFTPPMKTFSIGIQAGF